LHQVLAECWNWAESKENLHVISDEIYAGSVYRTPADGQPAWTSLATVAARRGRQLGPSAHLVWALSKDFALSGLRVGALYTENEAIRTPLQKLNDLCQVGSPTQAIVSRLLSDQLDAATPTKLWCAAMEEANAERLRSRYDRLTAVLDQGGIRYLDAGAGLFLWIDLRPFLSYGDSGPPQRDNSGLWAGAVGVEEALLPAREAEQRRSHEIRVTESRNGESESTGGGGASPLPAPHPRVRPPPPRGRLRGAGARPSQLRLARTLGLLLTPGASMRSEEPGLFRCVFSAATEEGFEVALQRFARLAAAPRAT